MLRCNTYPILSYADFSSTYGRFFKTLEEDKERETDQEREARETAANHEQETEQ